MPESAGQATQWGVMLASLIAAAGGLVTAWLNRRSSVDTTETDRARLEEDRRRQDINLIIETLQDDVEKLRLVVSSHEQTIEALRLENIDLRGDRAQLGLRVAEQDRTIAQLRARVAELEGKVS